MESVAPGVVLGSLRWRYAVKAFDPSRDIDPETWSALEEVLVLTPSSFGLQPWLFLVLEDRVLRETLVPHAWGQRQVAEASRLVVFCRRQDLGQEDIDRYLASITEIRGGRLESLTGLRQMLQGTLVEGPLREEINEWATRQVYIALGNFMTTAALLGVDTCPLEGFVPAKFDEILGLVPRGWASVVCCAAGYRSATDRYAGLPKVRYPRHSVVERR
jgi:nitroreductase